MINRKLGIAVMASLAICAMAVLPSCEKTVDMTTIEIEDQDRHYYPILQGEELELNYGFTNLGEEPLIIKEVQTSCGCMFVNDNLPIVILPHKKGYIHIKYNSTKNIGLVKHYIYCYGNIAPEGRAELRFDVHVVPDADYTRDYEELYREQRELSGAVSDAVDGGLQRGYYVDLP